MTGSEEFTIINNLSARDYLDVVKSLSNNLVELSKSRDKDIDNFTSMVNNLISKVVPLSPSTSSPLSSPSLLPSSFPSSLPSSSPSSLPSSLQPLLPPSQPLYSAEGVEISKPNNWLVPVNNFREACRVCTYYGHGFKQCPNIMDGYSNCCLKCWQSGHESMDCSNERVVTPYKNNYISSHQVIERIIVQYNIIP